MKRQMIGLFLVVEPFFAAAEQKRRSEYSGCDLSQLSLPRLEGSKSIIGQKQRHILYCREAETEEGVSVCVCVSPVLSITPLESRAPLPCSWRQ